VETSLVVLIHRLASSRKLFYSCQVNITPNNILKFLKRNFPQLWLAKIIIAFFLASQEFLLLCVWFSMQKRNSRHIRRQEKVSLLLIFKHMKVIQDALLYNKTECYNKEVQRSPSLSVKGCTHSLRYFHHSKYKMFGRAPKKKWSVLRRSNADYTMMHDVNIEEAHR